MKRKMSEENLLFLRTERENTEKSSGWIQAHGLKALRGERCERERI